MSVIIRLQNLPWSANAHDIREFFTGLSIPEGGVHIVGGELGDAFIAFSSDEDARLAMRKTGTALKGIQISLLLSSRTEMQKVIESARQQAIGLQTYVAPPTPVPQQGFQQPAPQTSSLPMQNLPAPNNPTGGQVPQMTTPQVASGMMYQDHMTGQSGYPNYGTHMPQFGYDNRTAVGNFPSHVMPHNMMASQFYGQHMPPAPMNEATPHIQRAPINETTPHIQRAPINEATHMQRAPINEATPHIQRAPINEATPHIQRAPINEATHMQRAPINEATPHIQRAENAHMNNAHGLGNAKAPDRVQQEIKEKPQTKDKKDNKGKDERRHRSKSRSKSRSRDRDRRRRSHRSRSRSRDRSNRHRRSRSRDRDRKDRDRQKDKGRSYRDRSEKNSQNEVKVTKSGVEGGIPGLGEIPNDIPKEGLSIFTSSSSNSQQEGPIISSGEWPKKEIKLDESKNLKREDHSKVPPQSIYSNPTATLPPLMNAPTPKNPSRPNFLLPDPIMPRDPMANIEDKREQVDPRKIMHNSQGYVGENLRGASRPSGKPLRDDYPPEEMEWSSKQPPIRGEGWERSRNGDWQGGDYNRQFGGETERREGEHPPRLAEAVRREGERPPRLPNIMSEGEKGRGPNYREEDRVRVPPIRDERNRPYPPRGEGLGRPIPGRGEERGGRLAPPERKRGILGAAPLMGPEEEEIPPPYYGEEERNSSWVEREGNDPFLMRTPSFAGRGDNYAQRGGRRGAFVGREGERGIDPPFREDTRERFDTYRGRGRGLSRGARNIGGNEYGPPRERNFRSTCVELLNCDPHLKYKAIKDYFVGAGIMIPNGAIKRLGDADGNPISIALIKFNSTRDAYEATKLTGTFLYDCCLEINLIDEGLYHEMKDIHDIVNGRFQNEKPQDNLFSPCLYVSGLPIGCTDHDVARVFAEFSVQDIVLEFKEGSRQPTGGCFVLLNSPEEAASVKLKLVVPNIDGTPITIDVCPKENMDLALIEREKIKNGKNIKLKDKKLENVVVEHNEKISADLLTDSVVIKNVSSDITEVSIRDFFSDEGLIPEKIYFNRPDSEGKCDVFVIFPKIENATRALVKNSQHLGDNKVNIELVAKPSVMMAMGLEFNPMELYQKGQDGLGHRSVLNTPNERVHPNELPRGHPHQHHQPLHHQYSAGPPRQLQRPKIPEITMAEPPSDFGEPGCVVALGNVPFSASTEDILEFFRDFPDLGAENIIRRYDEKNRPTADARVALPSPGDARKAIDRLNRKYMMNRQIFLSLVTN